MVCVRTGTNAHAEQPAAMFVSASVIADALLCLHIAQDSQGNDNVDGDYPKLDPHGAAVHLPTNSLITSDFILPVSTVTANVATYPIGELDAGTCCKSTLLRMSGVSRCVESHATGL
jgi:hypothetical protein